MADQIMFDPEHLTASTFGTEKSIELKFSKVETDRVYTIPDVGDNATFVMSSHNQIVCGELVLNNKTESVSINYETLKQLVDIAKKYEIMHKEFQAIKEQLAKRTTDLAELETLALPLQK